MIGLNAGKYAILSIVNIHASMNLAIGTSHFSVAHGGANDCQKHISRKSHKDMAEALTRTTVPLKHFVNKNSKPAALTAVTKAEGMMCALITDLNLPLAASDAFTSTF